MRDFKRTPPKEVPRKKIPPIFGTKSKFEGSKGPEMMKYPHSKATDLKKTTHTDRIVNNLREILHGLGGLGFSRMNFSIKSTKLSVKS